MSFTDPFAITIGGVASTLPRTSVGENESIYTSGDGTLVVRASHEYGKRNRRMLKVTTSKIAPDPYKEDENVERSMSFHVVFDLPQAGFTPAEAKAVSDGLIAAMTASSGALITKLLGGES